MTSDRRGRIQRLARKRRCTNDALFNETWYSTRCRGTWTNFFRRKGNLDEKCGWQRAEINLVNALNALRKVNQVGYFFFSHVVLAWGNAKECFGCSHLLGSGNRGARPADSCFCFVGQAPGFSDAAAHFKRARYPIQNVFCFLENADAFITPRTIPWIVVGAVRREGMPRK